MLLIFLSPRRVSKENEGKGEPEEKRYEATNAALHCEEEAGACLSVCVYVCAHA